jgi:hypothetical protein
MLYAARTKCDYTQIAYNSRRNRHCPKCQGAAAKERLAERDAELLPVPTPARGKIRKSAVSPSYTRLASAGPRPNAIFSSWPLTFSN